MCLFVCTCVCVVQLLEAQADYHRRSLSALEAVLPTIQAQQGKVHSYDSPLLSVSLKLHSIWGNRHPLTDILCLDSWMEKPAFGTALEEHLKRSNREIALPIEACVMMLLETGMKEEVSTICVGGQGWSDWIEVRDGWWEGTFTAENWRKNLEKLKLGSKRTWFRVILKFGWKGPVVFCMYFCWLYPHSRWVSDADKNLKPCVVDSL